MNLFILWLRRISDLILSGRSILSVTVMIFAIVSPFASASVFESKCAELLESNLAALRSNPRVKGNFWQTPWGNEIRFEFKLQKGGSGSLIVDEATKNIDLHCKLEKTIATDAQSSIGTWYQESFGEAANPQLKEADGFVSLSFKGLQRFSSIQTKKFVETILEVFGQDPEAPAPPAVRTPTAPQDSQYFNALIQKFPRFSFLASLSGFNWGQMLTPWGNFFQATRTIDERKITLSVEEANSATVVTIESLNNTPLTQIKIGNLTSTGDVTRQRLEGVQTLIDEQIASLLR